MALDRAGWTLDERPTVLSGARMALNSAQLGARKLDDA